MVTLDTNTNPETSWVLENLETLRLDSQFYHSRFLNTIKTINECGIDIENGDKIASKITQGPNPIFSETGTIPCLKTRNVYDDHITFEGCNYVTELEFKKHKKFRLLKDDILITIQGEGSIGKVNIYNSDQLAFFNRPIGLVRIIRNDIDPYFISIYLRSKFGKDVLERGISGTSGQKVLTTSYLKSIPFIVPSPEIQKYIGDKVRKAEKLRIEAEKTNEKTNYIFEQSLLKIDSRIFSYPSSRYYWVKSDLNSDRIDSQYYNPEYLALESIKKSSQFVILGEIIKSRFTGKTPKSIGPINEDSIPVLEVNLIGENVINYDKINIWTSIDKKYQLLQQNDLLITRVGTVGACAIYEAKYPKSYVSDNIICLRINEDYFPRYIAYYINSTIGKLQIKRIAKGAVQKVINNESIDEIIIPLLDHEIMLRMDTLIQQTKNYQQESRTLRESAIKDVEDLVEDKFEMKKEYMNLID